MRVGLYQTADRLTPDMDTSAKSTPDPAAPDEAANFPLSCSAGMAAG